MRKLIAWLIVPAILAVVFFACFAVAAERDYHHIVVLGDPHLPGATLEEKERVRARINDWKDVGLVVAVGDITETVGSEAEYAAAKTYFGKFNKPLAIIGGNHDYIFAETVSKMGKLIRAKSSVRAAKLNLLRKTFGLREVYYTKDIGNYLLVFLTPDDLQATSFATLSTAQYKWFAATLKANRHKPTIVFFHAPLEGTHEQYGMHVNTDGYIAQPKNEIRGILADNPQVFMWVSGHTHTSPNKPGFASDVNLYDRRVMNVHNTDMKRERIYTNSLYLYADRVEVRTFDHKKGRWLARFARTVPVPKLR
jgi:3',5'-cyclic-AMP phosphodiesterase